MAYKVHSTKDYHVRVLETLGWEWTVCNSLQQEGSPLRRILRRNASYGALLSDYLQRFIPMEKVKSVIEIGGGYGGLMKDLLQRHAFQRVTMLDLSPLLLRAQRETLADHSVEYIEGDFLDMDPSRLRGFDRQRAWVCGRIHGPLAPEGIRRGHPQREPRRFPRHHGSR